MLNREEGKCLEAAKCWFVPEFYPAEAHVRIEQGWEWMLRTVKGQPLKDLRGRLTKGNQIRSAIDELLLASGLVSVFSEAAVTAYPKIGGTQKRAEFAVRHQDCTFHFEATGLTSPEEEDLMAKAIEEGDHCWFKSSTQTLDMGRLCEKIATKVAERLMSEPLILCLNQFALSPFPQEASERLRQFLLEPHRYGVPSSIHLLGVAYAWGFRAQGMWLKKDVCTKYHVSSEMTEQLKLAIQESFLPRDDLKFEWAVI